MQPVNCAVRQRIEEKQHRVDETRPISNRKIAPLPIAISNLVEVKHAGDPQRRNRGANGFRPLQSAAAKLRLLGTLLCAAITVSLISPALAQQQAALPNGASSLQETYQDWQLSCTIRDNARACVISQDQSQQNGQRLLAVEFGMRSDGAVATLLLPFGILFDPGVAPQIDDQPALPALHFRTCLPTGCVAVFPINAETLRKLRTGSVLKLKVTTAAQTALTFPVSLKGLTAAVDRLGVLGGS
ncbi:invasion protein IalB [Rhizobium sullae]|uniref:Invasion protein IalB n=1 Tax=Rhizobium sullae TaxID=50338 RepID=A0A4R3Q204_RHISU|nr:invasion protein IalB [Rhizobium sullae]